MPLKLEPMIYRCRKCRYRGLEFRFWPKYTCCIGQMLTPTGSVTYAGQWIKNRYEEMNRNPAPTVCLHCGTWGMWNLTPVCLSSRKKRRDSKGGRKPKCQEVKE